MSMCNFSKKVSIRKHTLTSKFLHFVTARLILCLDFSVVNVNFVGFDLSMNLTNL